jgi:acyl carrier protein
MDKDFNEEIFGKVAGIIIAVTGNAGITIEPGYTANDIRNWDSLRHVMIINEIENHFAIRFELMEMLEINTVADLCRAVAEKKKHAR